MRVISPDSLGQAIHAAKRVGGPSYLRPLPLPSTICMDSKAITPSS